MIITVGASMAEKFNEVDSERLRDPLDYMKNEVKKFICVLT